MTSLAPKLSAIAAFSLFANAVFAAPTLAQERIVCAAAMHVLFGKPYLFVETTKIEGVTVQRFRNANGTYENACYLHGSRVVWRTDKSPTHTSPGRWRLHPADELVTGTVSGDSVTIDMKYSDGSGTPKSFRVTDLLASSKLPR